MRSRVLLFLVAVTVVCIGAYWYWSPYLALYAIMSAAERRDAEAVNAKIDYPAVRSSLKAQLAGSVTRQASGVTHGSEIGKAGSAIVISMTDKMVDALVTPETLMRALREGRLRPATQLKGEDSIGSTSAQKRFDWSFSRPTMNRLVVSATTAETDKGYGLAVVLDRHGFADWKISEFRLPSATK